MEYVTTNIRFTREQYLDLKEEAAQSQKSLSEVVRWRVSQPKRHPVDVARMMGRLEALARRTSEENPNSDSLRVIREMRDES